MATTRNGRFEHLSLLLAVTLCSPFAFARDEPTTASYVDDKTDRIPEQTIVPKYPRTARRDRIEGEVQVCYFVDKKGRPYNIAVRRSTHRIFERPAIKAMRASRYKPLQSGEKTSGLKSCRTFTFELDPVVAENGATKPR